MDILHILQQPWHWAFSGFMIVLVMYLLIFLGQRLSVSTSFESMCSAVGAGKSCSYFDFDWKEHYWLLLFVAGSIIGGFIASHFMADPNPVQISTATISDLNNLGVEAPSVGLYPKELFSLESLKTAKGIILFVLGGFLVGFGTRYAGGCTSGHAISGLSNLQLPSLVAVIGFFIGGLLMTHVLFPFIFQL
jgi:uncharacterized membrane protein YedE/YeeE